MSRHISNECYLAAALLLFFGMAPGNPAGPSRPLQFMLAIACAGAAVLVRQGTPLGRMAGIAAAGSTAAYGVLCLWTGRGFVTGSFIAVYTLVRLLGSSEFFTAAVVGYPPQQMGAGAPQQWTPAGPALATTRAAYQPQQPFQPQPTFQPQHPYQPQLTTPATPQWSDAQLQHYFAPPAYAPPPPPPDNKPAP